MEGQDHYDQSIVTSQKDPQWVSGSSQSMCHAESHAVLIVLLSCSDQDDADMGYKPVHFRKVFLDDDGVEEDPEDASSRHSDEEDCDDNHHDSDDGFHYSDDHENYSGESEHEGDTTQQETQE